MILRGPLKRFKFRKRLIWIVCGLTLLYTTFNQDGRWSTSLEDNHTYLSSERWRKGLSGSQDLIRPQQLQKEGTRRNVGQIHFSTTTNASSFDLLTSQSSSPMVIYPDVARRSLQVWRKDAQCGGFKVRFTKFETLPKCGLTSYPGSGNTWLRGLIEEATGIFTGSVYNDGQLYLAGHLGEFEPWYSGTTIVQKSHGSSKDTVWQFNKRGIILMRNPYRAIMAYHNYLFAGHHLYAPVSNYRRKDWPAFVHIQIKHWLETFIHWVTEGKDVLVVHYENLRQNLRQELNIILSFLRVPIDEMRLNCTLKNSHKGFRRKDQRFPKSLTIYPKETRNKLDRAIRYASFLLRKHGHQTPPGRLYEFYNLTAPKEVSFVACEEKESVFECDARVDEINRKIGFEEKRIKIIAAKSRNLMKT